MPKLVLNGRVLFSTIGGFRERISIFAALLYWQYADCTMGLCRFMAGLGGMMVGKRIDPDDWRVAENYKHQRLMDRSGWAWNWLSRNDDFGSQIIQTPISDAEVSGLKIFRSELRPNLYPWGVSFRH
ncbi:hypothetical protein OVA03_07815 [Asticcacaulis sp. SL142]|uniref:transcriptional regulator domain-containing protein n=1 Tax=Asticcacaulis sp. SL142 TaxID=2995155 RepID=UPI00226D2895|nr:hypothetical protein [Asticcacaulis sp. SL142]WAC49795.1 hypothetical protein OVA03_07815 [Asticcacaulis sp. SL142]